MCFNVPVTGHLKILAKILPINCRTLIRTNILGRRDFLSDRSGAAFLVPTVTRCLENANYTIHHHSRLFPIKIPQNSDGNP